MATIIRQPAGVEQIAQMSETYYGLMIKLAVDVKREILAGGGELHADWEQALLLIIRNKLSLEAGCQE